jgi:hypothetical protein
MWNNLSIDEKNILCENISKGLKTYHKNLSKDEKEKTYSRLKQYQTKEQIQSLLDWNKSEENLKSKSLSVYVEKFKPDLALRLSMSFYREQQWLQNFPLYAVFLI